MFAEGESPQGFGWCLARSGESKRRRGWNERFEQYTKVEEGRARGGGPTVRDPL